MKCPNCGCHYEDTDKRCPMCDLPQSAARRTARNSSPSPEAVPSRPLDEPMQPIPQNKPKSSNPIKRILLIVLFLFFVFNVGLPIFMHLVFLLLY